jgi:signal peptidase I
MAHIHRAEGRLTSLDVSPSPPEPAAPADLSLADPLADSPPAQSLTTESPPSEPPPPDSGDGSDAATPPPPPRSRLRRVMVPWGIIVVLGLVIAVVVRLFVFQLYYVPSTSMNPTIKAGDRILVDKLAFHLHPVERGDIIVFRRPAAATCGEGLDDFVKRVIGLPGETISGKDGQVYIDGKRLAEPWLPKVSTTYTATFGPDKIPAGDYFMMGDHRTTSCDSRYWGPIKRSAVIGEVVMRIWPISSLRFY